MNSTEQKAHRTVTQALDARIDDLALVVETMDARIGAALINTQRQVSLAVNVQRECCQERWYETAKAQKRIFDHLSSLLAHRDLGFWGRLRWLLRGTK